MSHLSDPDRLERLAVYLCDDPPNTFPAEVARALTDAAERIRSLQARVEEAHAAGLLADPTTSLTDDEQAVIEAAIAVATTERARMALGLRPPDQERLGAAGKCVAAFHDLFAAVDRLAAPGPKEAT